MKKNTSSDQKLRFAILATDIALLTVRNGELLVRLVKVDRPPHFPNTKGLPGGLIEPTETAEEAAVRLLRTKAGIASKQLHIEQLYTFSELDRDPRGRVVAVAYLALIPWEALSAQEQMDTEHSWWTPLRSGMHLAYDHDIISATALNRLRSKVKYTTLISKLIPKEFTLTELERVYESILRTEIDKRNFRKKILHIHILTPLNRKRSGTAHRPAELYRFTDTKVKEVAII